MKLHGLLPFALGVTALATATLASAQTVPTARGPYHNPYAFSVGFGLSNFDVDWNKSRMTGFTGWADWGLTFLPYPLKGLSLEAEGRDINYGRPATVPANFRQDTLLFGPRLTFARSRYFQPYIKALEGTGSIDTYIPAHGNVPAVHHEKQIVGAPGAGMQFDIRHHIFARVEFEYQSWPNAFGVGIQPEGFSAGVTYNFNSPGRGGAPWRR